MSGGRAISSVLDVSICLLLVTASAVVLTNAPPRRPTDHDSAPDADAVLETIATTTAWIGYSPPARDRSSATRANWTAHGTLAELLAATTVSNATVHERRIDSGSTEFRRTVVGRVRQTIHEMAGRIQLLATWKPYPGSHVRGSVSVGPSPPPSADVSAATMVVPLRSTGTRERVQAAARSGGFEGVAEIVATESNDRIPTPISHDASDRVQARDVEADLRVQFDTPMQAARAVRVEQIRLTVRTWSP